MADQKTTGNDSKVFDVAKPEDAQLNTGAKPMVIGHKTLAADPAIRAVEETPKEETAAEQTPATPKKVVITPPKEAEPASENQPAPETNTTEEKPETSPDGAKESSETSDEAQLDARKTEVEEMVNSKEYFVPIKQKNSGGVGKFFGVFFLVLLTVAVVLGALLYSGVVQTEYDLPFLNKSSEAPAETTTAQPAEETSDADTLQQTADLYSLEVPESWQYARSRVSVADSTYPYFVDTYTLPSGVTLTIGQGSWGRGGVCEPNDDDVPHQAGNACPTLELLEKEELTQTVPLEEKFLVPSKIFLVRQHFTSAEGESSYSLCLETYTDSEEGFSLEVGEPYMGFVIEGCGPGLEIKDEQALVVVIEGVDRSSVSFFENEDVQEIERVLKTFKLL